MLKPDPENPVNSKFQGEGLVDLPDEKEEGGGAGSRGCAPPPAVAGEGREEGKVNTPHPPQDFKIFRNPWNHVCFTGPWPLTPDPQNLSPQHVF